MKNPNIGKRLGVAFGFLILVLIGVGWLGLSRMGQINRDLEKIVDNRWTKVQLSRAALNYSNLNNRITMQVFLLRDKTEVDQLLVQRAQNSEQVTEILRKLEARAESPTEEDLLLKIRHYRTPYVDSYKQALGLIDAQKYDQARVKMSSETLPMLVAYHDAWNAFVERQGSQLDHAVTESVSRHARARRLALLLIVLAVCIAVAIALFVTRSMVRYLANLAAAEGALQQALVSAQNSEQSYRELADAMPQMVWTANPDGSIDYYNRQWIDYTGITVGQATNSGWHSVLHPHDLQRCVEVRSAAMKTGERYEIKYRLKRSSNGSYRWHLGRASAVRDTAGRVVKWYGTCTDIDDQQLAEDSLLIVQEELEARVQGRTSELADANAGLMLEIAERKRAEDALRESEANFKVLFDEAPVAYHELDREGRIVRVNLTEQQLLGYTAEELQGRRASEFIVEQVSQEAIEAKLSGAAPLRPVERTFIRKDGTHVLLLIHDQLIQDQLGNVIGLRSTLHDISERQKLEADLELARDAALESARLKSEFLANMSHEIRTPMNGIIGMTGLLLETALDTDQQDFAETIRASSDALLTLINDILDFSKIEAGKLIFEQVDFDLRYAVEGTVELLAEKARTKQLEFASLTYQNVPTALRGDPGRLRQVLTNLVGNALKFTDEGEVIVRAEKEAESETHVTIRFSVSDTGIGISEAEQSRLFQAFMQADGSTTRKYGGTGLGLSISKQLVEMMGGQIGLTSAPRCGSTFWFTAKLEKQLVGDEPPLALLERLDQLRVIIVDDNATNRKILSHQLGSWGMIHDAADSGARGLEMMRAAAAKGVSYDLAVLDLLMPVMDGFELARAIKSDPTISGVPLVLLTSAGDRNDGATAREAGIAAYLTKPVRQSQLFDCLTTVISTSAQAGSESGSSGKEPSKLITAHTLQETKRMSTKLILLAEDNIVNQKVAMRQLQKLGYRADAVSNGREALEALMRNPYDLVLMDCQMPEIDGYEATAEIRRREGVARHTPIVAMTAHALTGDREKSLAAGMDDHITKPVKQEQLGQLLERFFFNDVDRAFSSTMARRNGPPVDLQRLYEAMGDDPKELEEILGIYLEQMAESLAKLEVAIESGNVEEISLIAHNCAGTSANCGMVGVVESLRSLESMVREDQIAGAAGLTAKINEEFAEVRRFLAENFDPVAV